MIGFTPLTQIYHFLLPDMFSMDYPCIRDMSLEIHLIRTFAPPELHFNELDAMVFWDLLSDIVDLETARGRRDQEFIVKNTYPFIPYTTVATTHIQFISRI